MAQDSFCDYKPVDEGFNTAPYLFDQLIKRLKHIDWQKLYDYVSNDLRLSWSKLGNQSSTSKMHVS